MAPRTAVRPTAEKIRLVAALRAQLASLQQQNLALKRRRFRTAAFLTGQVRSILDFYVPVAIDPAGGYNNQLLELRIDRVLEGVQTPVRLETREVKLLQPFGNDFDDFG